jgi:hypothetical protein
LNNMASPAWMVTLSGAKVVPELPMVSVTENKDSVQKIPAIKTANKSFIKTSNIVTKWEKLYSEPQRREQSHVPFRLVHYQPSAIVLVNEESYNFMELFKGVFDHFLRYIVITPKSLFSYT